MTFPSYSVGTVSVKKGDTVIVGTGGPLWTSTANARAGDDIIIAGHIWPLSDVIDATHLAIDPWPFDDVPAGTPYKILQRSPLRFAGGDAAADVMQLVGALNTAGLSFIVPIGVAAPDPSLGEENQFAIQPSTFKIWLKTGGQWVFQGIFKGFQVRGPYSATAAYVVNDVVSQDGASYVALVDNMGQPVTNAAVWALFAAKGDTGAQGPQGASYAATSTTSLTIGTGPQTFVTQAGLAYSAGARARASSSVNGANYMEGLVTAYSDVSLTISVTRTGGSGTFAGWNINLAGDPGPGDLMSGNNLSDVSNKDAALANLRGVSFGVAQTLTQAPQAQARTNIYAAPFDALAFNGMQVNGSCEIAQESGGAALTGLVGGTFREVADGWRIATAGSEVVTAQQVTDAPSGYGASVKVSVTTANASPGATDFLFINQRIEGFRARRLAWGTAAASPLSLGFWVKAHRIGSYSGSIRNGAANRSWVFTFSISASDTWEYKTTTVSGDVAGTWA